MFLLLNEVGLSLKQMLVPHSIGWHHLDHSTLVSFCWLPRPQGVSILPPEIILAMSGVNEFVYRGILPACLDALQQIGIWHRRKSVRALSLQASCLACFMDYGWMITSKFTLRSSGLERFLQALSSLAEERTGSLIMPIVAHGV
jgi:hypothetical protein